MLTAEDRERFLSAIKEYVYQERRHPIMIMSRRSLYILAIIAAASLTGCAGLGAVGAGIGYAANPGLYQPVPSTFTTCTRYNFGYYRYVSCI
jgi:hypothetical protein